ncbi:hypothetical protein CY34DRAFT_708901 [Suillus luteus UH-Slu-Lm8-n1]|uniref:Uncharacterized protein n=1 Tax=Suillus luteus UH-Slu-Lm8-n1 TaxID=930992 RepID=A0A0D0AGY9_9AGAM|nr:hypothetical protein CY34DRAFT_708901 [Suillus luteus UH-Slu-Lm8-n1]
MGIAGPIYFPDINLPQRTWYLSLIPKKQFASTACTRTPLERVVPHFGSGIREQYGAHCAAVAGNWTALNSFFLALYRAMSCYRFNIIMAPLAALVVYKMPSPMLLTRDP